LLFPAEGDLFEVPNNSGGKQGRVKKTRETKDFPVSGERRGLHGVGFGGLGRKREDFFGLGTKQEIGRKRWGNRKKEGSQ